MWRYGSPSLVSGMASSGVYVCLDCRVGGKGLYPACVRGNHRTEFIGKKISIPKKNNVRAWKRMEDGEWLWNRRKSRRLRCRGGWFKNNTIPKPNMKKGQLKNFMEDRSGFPGPDVDLGG